MGRGSLDALLSCLFCLHPLLFFCVSAFKPSDLSDFGVAQFLFFGRGSMSDKLLTSLSVDTAD